MYVKFCVWTGSCIDKEYPGIVVSININIPFIYYM